MHATKTYDKVLQTSESRNILQSYNYSTGVYCEITLEDMQLCCKVLQSLQVCTPVVSSLVGTVFLSKGSYSKAWINKYTQVYTDLGDRMQLCRKLGTKFLN